jgi:hypothetical protein
VTKDDHHFNPAACWQQDGETVSHSDGMMHVIRFSRKRVIRNANFRFQLHSTEPPFTMRNDRSEAVILVNLNLTTVYIPLSERRKPVLGKRLRVSFTGERVTNLFSKFEH